MENHNIVHHKLDAIKAIKSGWKHIMRSPWTYIGCTIIFLFVSAIIGNINTPSIILDNLVTYALDAFVTMVVIRLLLDKYEERNININFTFKEYLNFAIAQLLLGIAACIMFLAVSVPTLYTIYNVTVTDKEALAADIRTIIEYKYRNSSNHNSDIFTNKVDSAFTFESDDAYSSVDITQYFDIANHSTMVLSLLTIFLIGLCAIIYLLFRVSLTQWLLIDKKLNPIEAIKNSWHITRNNVTQMSVLAIISSFIVIVVAFALFVGVLFAIPLVYMITLCAYKQMIGESK